MLYAIKHHRAVIKKIIEFGDLEFDVVRNIEPVSPRAVDNALSLLAQRPDLAIGMEVDRANEDGLKLELLRGGREIFITIDGKGRVTFLSSASVSIEDTPSTTRQSIRDDFMSFVNDHLPDPIETTGSHMMPKAGCLIQSSNTQWATISTGNTTFQAFPLQNAKFGFDFICFRQENLDFDGVMRLALEQRQGVYIARRFNQGEHVSLHCLTDCPDEILQGSILPNGEKTGSVKVRLLKWQVEPATGEAVA